MLRQHHSSGGLNGQAQEGGSEDTVLVEHLQSVGPLILVGLDPTDVDGAYHTGCQNDLELEDSIVFKREDNCHEDGSAEQEHEVEA